MEHFKDTICYGLMISAEDKYNYYKTIVMKNLESKPVPTDLKEAVDTLIEGIPDSLIEKIKQKEIDPTLGHFSFGRWLRNNWGLWSGGELQKWFHGKGIRHADDMSGIILETFKREVRGEDWDLDGQINYYREYWKKKGVDPDKIGMENE